MKTLLFLISIGPFDKSNSVVFAVVLQALSVPLTKFPESTASTRDSKSEKQDVSVALGTSVGDTVCDGKLEADIEGMTEEDGMTELDGRLEGIVDGWLEGAVTGICEGRGVEGIIEGIVEGIVEGIIEGIVEGSRDGIFVEGENEGVSDERGVGTIVDIGSVGSLVGLSETGATDGEIVVSPAGWGVVSSLAPTHDPEVKATQDSSSPARIPPQSLSKKSCPFP